MSLHVQPPTIQPKYNCMKMLRQNDNEADEAEMTLFYQGQLTPKADKWFLPSIPFYLLPSVRPFLYQCIEEGLRL